MNAHLIRFAAGGHAAVPNGTTASCRLDAGDGAGWLLALTEAADSPFEVEQLYGRPHGRGASAAVVEFDGPRDAVQVAADRRASRERIAPAALQVDGALGALVLRAPDGAMVTVAFADSHASLEASSRAILSTPLLPGEDPALLGGPDRWTACHVVGDDVAAVLRRSAAVTA